LRRFSRDFSGRGATYGHLHQLQGEDYVTQKTALILSVVLTAFLLVVGGGVIARVSQPEAVPVAAPTAAPVVPAPSIDVTAQVQELVQQREVQYRQLIDQANQRLTAMNQQLVAVSSVTQAAPAAPAARAAAPAPAPAQPAAPQITLSPDSARDIAVQAANFATMIRTPELVRFEGKVAYEVGFTRGVVYIDATSGAVLLNGTQGKGGGQSSPPPSSGDDYDHHDDHGDDHGDDHD
jgi:Peptidase propeptide and YPEB domain